MKTIVSTSFPIYAEFMSRELYPWLDKFEYSWAFDPFLEDPSFIAKRMFGGVAGYFDGQLVLVIMESTGDREWKGKHYDFDLWHGIMVPSRKERHLEIRKDFPELRFHPVLYNWLFLPTDTEDFESIVQKIQRKIKNKDPLYGVIPGEKSKKRKKSKKRSKAKLVRKKK